jgi:peptide/nickel transport system permease protein
MSIENEGAMLEERGLEARPPRRRSTLRGLLRNPIAVAALAFLALVVVVAILAPWIAPWGPQETDLDATNAPPGTPGHPLGGDSAGLDILSRLIWGSRQTVLAVIIVLVVSLVVGVTTGLIAGFYRGRFEGFAGFVTDVVMSLPSVILLIALYALTGPNIALAMAVFGLLVAPTYYRLVRSIVLGVRNELYVDAARVVGLSDSRIIGRHVLWAVRAPVIIHSSFIMAAAIGIEAGISFLGLGDPTTASWGVMLQRGFAGIYNNPWAVFWPALAIGLTILSLVLLGNALSDVLQESARSTIPTPRQREALLSTAQLRLPVGDATTAELDGDAILSIRDLRVGYPGPGGTVTEVVHGVDLDLRKGEVHGLVGESGSGKSQIAFATLGILPREALVISGTIELDGVDLQADPAAMQAARGRRIAYIPQEPMSNLDPSFTIGSQLSRGLRASRPMSKKAANVKLLGLLDRVGIREPERVMKLYPHEISGGMAQRILICGAVASDPDIIIADEPTTALDVTVQAEVLELLRELSDERGLAMLLVTHNLGVVADLCHRVSVMRAGHIIEHAEVDQIFASPGDPYTRELLTSSRSVELMEDLS